MDKRVCAVVLLTSFQACKRNESLTIKLLAGRIAAIVASVNGVGIMADITLIEISRANMYVASCALRQILLHADTDFALFKRTAS